MPFRGGGEVAVQLVGNHIEATVNNPIEAVTHWRSGALRPLCVFDGQRLAGAEPMADGKAWRDIPTAREAGPGRGVPDAARHLQPAGATPPQRVFYENLLARVRETPEWREMMAQGAFNTTTMSGERFPLLAGARGSPPPHPHAGSRLPGAARIIR